MEEHERHCGARPVSGSGTGTQAQMDKAHTVAGTRVALALAAVLHGVAGELGILARGLGKLLAKRLPLPAESERLEPPLE